MMSWVRISACYILITACSLFSAPRQLPNLAPMFYGGSSSGMLVDSAGYFAVPQPTDFKCKGTPGKFSCHATDGEALLTIGAYRTPKNANLGMIKLVQYEKYQSRPHFELALNHNIKLGSLIGSNRVYKYDRLGDVNHPVWIQIVESLEKNKLFQIKLKCRGVKCARYASALRSLAKGFKIAELDDKGRPKLGSLQKAMQSQDEGQSKPGLDAPVDEQLDSIFKELE